MAVTLFGSCRIDGVNNNNNLNNLINFTHSTKEVLQQIKFLLGEKPFPSPFDKLCFRTAIINNQPITHNSTFKNLFRESAVCVIEICSVKNYVYDNFFLHHLSVDKYYGWSHNTPQPVLDNFKCIKQTSSEIEADILEIKKLLAPRRIIIVSHYNAKLNGKYIESRRSLIVTLLEICEKHNILVINPSEVLKDYQQEDVMTNDMGHYTPFGKSKFTEYLNNYINEYSADMSENKHAENNT